MLLHIDRFNVVRDMRVTITELFNDVKENYLEGEIVPHGIYWMVTVKLSKESVRVRSHVARELRCR